MLRRLVRSFVRRLTGYDVVRVALAILLLTAAALKAYQLATQPVLATGLLDSRWVSIVAVEFELLFGLWLLVNIWPKPTWAAALACFGLFACISAYKALSGEATCGCFGRVPVHPWDTAALDLTAVASLVLWRPNGSGLAVPMRFPRLPRRALGVLVVWLCVGIPAAFLTGSHVDGTLSEAGEIIGGGKVVILKPETWVGKRFPLLDYIDIGDRLREGTWLVVLYHHKCSKCQAALSKYKRLPPRMSPHGETVELALVELPPYGTHLLESVFSEGSCAVGRLDSAWNWVAATPVQVTLDRTVVTEVGHQGNSTAAASFQDNVGEPPDG